MTKRKLAEQYRTVYIILVPDCHFKIAMRNIKNIQYKMESMVSTCDQDHSTAD